ncbi:mechanosensitive ion channel family protein [Leeia sp. TBRC 13508]|uniref:Mechanosensitive ion channel family protein n=1 Tax=Leeia speluncae TaxID=2884804 RepID=A0ABS8D702_9NEIS|nr:mechanosensitive ion channel family protein [Leeia speluncae]MCB6183952.1 mechanosensitive ion channel family protein [Leeia speluncae]
MTGISIWEKFADFLGHLSNTALRITLVVVLAYVAIHLAQKGIVALRKRITLRMGDNESKKRAETIGRVCRYIVTVVISLIAGMLILSELGVSVAPILGAAGVVGLAVGFGAQSLVKDYFTGFFLLLENQIRQGDVVKLGNHEGFVEEVTLRFVRLRDYEGNVHFVPNGTISTVVNKTREFAFAVLDVSAGYDDDLEMAIQTMQDTISKMRTQEKWQTIILDEFEFAGVDVLGEYGISLKGRIKVQPLQQWNVRREFLRQIKHAFDQKGLTIPYPQLTLHRPQEELVAHEDA